MAMNDLEWRQKRSSGEARRRMARRAEARGDRPKKTWKLSAEDIDAIQASGLPTKMLAELHGVSEKTIRRVR